MATTTTTTSEWVLVTTKKKAKSKRPQHGNKPQHANHARQAQAHARTTSAPSFDIDTTARIPADRQLKIQQRVERIAAALLQQCNDENGDPRSLVGSALRVIAQHLEWKSNETRRLHIVSYGLGSFCSSSNAVHQLAFVHALVAHVRAEFGPIDTTLEVFDPVMNASDREIAGTLGIVTIASNESGKRAAQTPAVFFMPHCGQPLYQNVIVANLEADTLHNAVIIGNSFAAYGDRLIDSAARRNSILLQVLPFLTETPLPLGLATSHQDFHAYESAFDDLSVHTLSCEQASAARSDPNLNALLQSLATTASSGSLIDQELIA